MHGHARMHLLARHSHLIPMDLFSQSSPNAFRNCRRSFRRARALRMYSRRLPTPITPTNAPIRRPFSSAQPGTGPAGSRTHAQRFTKHIDIPRRFRKRQRHAAHRPLAACARSAYRMLCYLPWRRRLCSSVTCALRVHCVESVRPLCAVSQSHAVALHRCAQQAKALAGIEYNTTRPLPVELFAACPADHNAYLDVIRT